MPTVKEKLSGLLAKVRKGGAPVKYDLAPGDSTAPGSELDAPASKELTVAQLKQGYGELMETMAAIRTHIDRQNERTETLLTTLESMPEVLKAIPEAAKAQTEALEAVRGDLAKQTQATTEVADAMDELSGTAKAQQQTMEQVQGHLVAEGEVRQELKDGVVELSASLDGVKQSQADTQAALIKVYDQAAIREQEMQKLLKESQKTQAWMTFAGWALAILALLMAGFAVFQLAKMGLGQDAPAATAEAALVAPVEPAAPTEAPTTTAQAGFIPAVAVAGSDDPEVAERAQALLATITAMPQPGVQSEMTVFEEEAIDDVDALSDLDAAAMDANRAAQEAMRAHWSTLMAGE